jgi:Domain of unknown function (DUF4382)
VRIRCVSIDLAKGCRLWLAAGLAFSAVLAGCGSFCVSGVINGGTGSGVGATCSITPPTGNVRISFHSPAQSALSSAMAGSAHAFVTLAGVEALPSTSTGEDAPAWRELAPRLAAHPVQVDLLSPVGDSCAPGALGSADVPTGVYTQLRLRFAPNRLQGPLPESAPANDSSEATAACSGLGFNCLVSPDGSVRPLAWDDPPELRIPSDGIDGGFVRVAADSRIELKIALGASSAIAAPGSDSLRLIPAFSVSAEASCDSDRSAAP